MSEKTLTIDLNEVYKLKSEKPGNFETSFFRDVYEKAAEATDDIIQQTNKFHNENNTLLRRSSQCYEISTQDIHTTVYQKERQEYNNIIAFTGDRGAGKTSAMVNYAQFLVKHQATEWETKNEKIIALEKYQFIGLPTIDPSLFEKDENIMEVMLAQMFSQFENKIKNKQSDIDIDKKRKILEQFEKVYENLQTIKKDTKNYDGEAIETLSKMAASTKLRENFRELVLQYITLFTTESDTKENNKNSFLVIAIDDFDLNVKGAVEMSEQIRKYFMIPNVIILMAVNMAQLKDAKELSIRTEFKEIIEHMEEHPSNMTLLYLLKLIPDNRRLLMPQIDKDTKIKIQNSNETKLLNPDYDIPKEYNLEEVTYQIINYYTGLIILPSIFNDKSNVNTHYNVIIYNMRKYVNLLVLLLKNMKAPEGKGNKLHNIKVFEQYFINNIIGNTIKERDAREVIKEIVSYNSNRLNKFVITSIFAEFKKTKKKYEELPISDSLIKDDGLEKRILNQNTNSSNLSLADVLFFANNYSTVFNNTEEDTFIDAIKMAYSIKMTKLVLAERYDELQLILGDNILSKPIEDEMKDNIPPSPLYETYYKKEIKELSKEEEQQLIFFTPYWGSSDNYKNRRTEKNIYYRDILTNKTECTFNIYAFLPLQFSEESTTKRLSLSETSSTGNQNQTADWNPISLPIYSIDFIENILDTNEIYVLPSTRLEYSKDNIIITTIKEKINAFWRDYNYNLQNTTALTDIKTQYSYSHKSFVNDFINNETLWNKIFNNNTPNK